MKLKKVSICFFAVLVSFILPIENTVSADRFSFSLGKSFVDFISKLRLATTNKASLASFNLFNCTFVINRSLAIQNADIQIPENLL